MNEENNNEYRGYALFNDVEDAELRCRNRACVLANILEKGNSDKGVSARCAADSIGYFSLIPMEERRAVVERLQVVLQERGLSIRPIGVH